MRMPKFSGNERLQAYRQSKYTKALNLSEFVQVGGPPPGFNNYFVVFFNKGTLPQRIYYYFMSTVLFTLFGWFPLFRPIYLRWHWRQVISRVKCTKSDRVQR